MKQVCSGYSSIPKATCNSLAWTYYQAVRQFGTLNVTEAQIERIRQTAEQTAQNAEA
jgi:hypothetical protein